MAAGDIHRTQELVADVVTVKANEDIELGELVVNDGNGYLAATAALAALNRPAVALKAHDYSEESNHKITIGVHGVFTVQKKAGAAIVKGNKLMISSTAGEVQAFAAGDVTSSVSEATVEAANLVNLGAFGECYEDAASDATTVKIRL